MNALSGENATAHASPARAGNAESGVKVVPLRVYTVMRGEAWCATASSVPSGENIALRDIALSG